MTAQEDLSDSGWAALLLGPNRRVFLVLCFGVWLYAADCTVIATLMPSVVSELGGESVLFWNYVLYLLASITAACSAALIGRRFGLRRAAVMAALIVGMGCAVSAVTPSMAGMLIGRAAQGFGGGMLVALVTIGVADLFPSRFTPRVLAAISAVWGASSFVGPLVGGIFAEIGMWRMGFWAFAGQAVLLTLLLGWALPGTATASGAVTHFPWRRLSVLSGSIAAIGLAGAGLFPLSVAIMLCGIGAVGLVIFLRLDRAAGTEDRLLPKQAADLRHTVGIACFGIFLLALSTIPFTVYGPVLMDRIHGLGPLQVGYMITLESVAWTAGAFSLSNVSGRRQTIVIQAAFWVVLVAVVGQALFVTPGPVWALLPFLTLAGFGFGACFGHVLQRAVEAAGPDDRDRAAGAATTVQTIGYALGAAICGLVANLVGYGDSGTVAGTLAGTIAGAEAAGIWVFAAMIPFALLAVFLVHRLR